MRIFVIIFLMLNIQQIFADEVYYSVNPKDPYSPAVKTDKPETNKCCYLTAPNRNVSVIAEGKTVPAHAKPTLKIAEKKHQLKPLAVGGLLRNPRVQFNQAGYQFKPLGTKVESPYKNKVFDNSAADQF